MYRAGLKPQLTTETKLGPARMTQRLCLPFGKITVSSGCLQRPGECCWATRRKEEMLPVEDGGREGGFRPRIVSLKTGVKEKLACAQFSGSLLLSFSKLAH